VIGSPSSRTSTRIGSPSGPMKTSLTRTQATRSFSTGRRLEQERGAVASVQVSGGIHGAPMAIFVGGRPSLGSQVDGVTDGHGRTDWSSASYPKNERMASSVYFHLCER